MTKSLENNAALLTSGESIITGDSYRNIWDNTWYKITGFLPIENDTKVFTKLGHSYLSELDPQNIERTRFYDYAMVDMHSGKTIEQGKFRFWWRLEDSISISKVDNRLDHIRTESSLNYYIRNSYLSDLIESNIIEITGEASGIDSLFITIENQEVIISREFSDAPGTINFRFAESD